GGHLASVVHADRIDVDTTIRWAAAAPRFAALPNGADGRKWLQLQLDDRTLRLPEAARDPIEQLATSPAMRVGDIPGLDPSSQLTLARRLIAERACVIAERACVIAGLPGEHPG